MKKSTLFSAIVLSAALMSPALVIAETGSASIETLISEMAEKPAQHQAIANYFKEKIAESRKELAVHKKMRKAYEVGHPNNRSMSGMRKHCDKLIKNTESNIKAYEALVAEHEAVASKKP